MYKGSTILIIILFLSGCQKEIWGDDVDRLLSDWKSKTWKETTSKIEKTYYWSKPQRFSYKDGANGLWFIPIAGILRETTFNTRDTTVSDFKIIYINVNEFKIQSLDQSDKVYIYHVK